MKCWTAILHYTSPHPSALRAARSALSLSPHPSARHSTMTTPYACGLSLYASHKYEEALGSFTAALPPSPASPNASLAKVYHARARCHDKLGRSRDALLDARGVVRCSPEDYRVSCARAARRRQRELTICEGAGLSVGGQAVEESWRAGEGAHNARASAGEATGEWEGRCESGRSELLGEASATYG